MPLLLPWPAPPAAPALEPGWVHVFCLRLDLPSARLAGLRGSLSPDELGRASRYRRAADGQHFIAARGQMREILAAYTGVAPASLRFSYNPHGKPALAGGEPRFNLSHSAGLGLLAVALNQEVGVDIERLDRVVDYANIAARFFAPEEAAALRALPAASQARGFYNGWTRKEAYIKARGQGLAIPLDSFTVSLAPGEPPRLDGPSGASLYALEPGPGYAAALVVLGPVRGLRCWTW